MFKAVNLVSYASWKILLKKINYCHLMVREQAALLVSGRSLSTEAFWSRVQRSGELVYKSSSCLASPPGSEGDRRFSDDRFQTPSASVCDSGLESLVTNYNTSEAETASFQSNKRRR